MSSYTVDFPLLPGDRLAYAGPHLKTCEIVTVSIDQARELAHRISDESRKLEATRYLDLLQQGGAGPIRPVDLRIPINTLEEVAHAG